MKPSILIITPAPAGSRKGNRITAERWRDLLRSAGYAVKIAEDFARQKVDLLVALHAKKSASAIARFHAAAPEKPLCVVLTGTDIYHDLRSSAAARQSLDVASKLIVLQPEAMQALKPAWRRKAMVIIQSAVPPRKPRPARTDSFEICVVGHLRPVKDPFRAALASRLLPPESQVRIVQIGRALTPHMETRAQREMLRNRRFTWLGELSHQQTRERMVQCRALVLSSRLEGGANVISEAVVAGVPVLASRIAGSIGLLGRNYPGFFEVGDTHGLAKLMQQAETDSTYLERLKNWCLQLRPRFTPQQELASWCELLRELLPSSPTAPSESKPG